jgi:hypothetical protein
MTLKQFSNEQFINFIKYIKTEILYADNVILSLCNDKKNIMLYINIISEDCLTNINLQLDYNYKISIVSGFLPNDKINIIEKYIKQNLIIEEKYEIEI